MAINSNNIPVITLDGGLKQNQSSVAIEPNYCPRCENLVIHDGVVKKRTGLVWVGGTFSANTPAQILKYYHYRNFSTTTRKRFLSFGLYLDTTWDLVTHYYNAGNWTLVTHDDTGLSVDYDYWVNVCEVVDGDASGDPTNEYLIINITPTDPSNVTNGCAKIFKMDQGAETPALATSTNWNKGKVVLSYFGRLVVLGADYSHRIEWSAQWNNDTVYDTAGSGYFYSYDTGGSIMNGALLKDTIACYKEDSIWSGTRLTSEPYIRWSCVYPDVGLMAPRLLATWGNYHIFVGTNNIYLYAGGTELYKIGDPIWTSFISDLRDGGVDANRLYKNRSFASVHRDKGDIAFWIPTGSSPYPNMAYVYNVFQKTWVKWVLPRVTGTPNYDLCLTGYGEYEHDNTITDAEYVPFYGAARGNETSGALDSPKVLKFDFSTYSDPLPDADGALDTDTSAIDGWWESKDFVESIEEPATWSRLYVEAKGHGTTPNIDVGLSTDSGTTYTETSDISLSTDYDVFPVLFNRRNYKSRYRVRNADKSKGFSLRALEIQPASDERTEA